MTSVIIKYSKNVQERYLGNMDRRQHERVKKKRATCQYGLVQQRTEQFGFEGVGRQETYAWLSLRVKMGIMVHLNIAHITRPSSTTAHALSVCVRLVPRYNRTQTAIACTASEGGVRIRIAVRSCLNM